MSWPDKYYLEYDFFKRKDYLDEALLNNNNSKDDTRRLEIYNKRYVIFNNRYIDNFIDAWLVIRLYQNPTFLMNNEKKAKEEIQLQANKLLLIEEQKDDLLFEEWKHFARLYLKTCLEGKTYKSKFLTFFTLDEKQLALKIAQDIDYGTRIVANVAGLKEEFKPLRTIMFDEYMKILNKEYLDSYLKQENIEI